jgi:Na+-driven multidrug efflux pump
MAHSDTIKSANLSKTKALRFGAALATVIGQGTSFALSIVYLYRRREMFHFDFRPESFRPDAHTMGRLVGLGIPMSIQSMSVNLSKTVLMS